MRTTAEHPTEPSPETLLDEIHLQETQLFGRLTELREQIESLRNYEAMRARLVWDEDRRAEVEELGDRLSRKPASVRARLAQSKHGALWLVDRWKALGGLLDRGLSWNEAQCRLAFDLLGVDPALRSGEPWIAAGVATPRALVDREVKGLQAAVSRTLGDLDDQERRRASAGCPVQPSRELLRLRREEVACWRRLLALHRRAEKESRRMLEQYESEDEEDPAVAESPPPTPLPRPSAPPPAQVPSPPPAPVGNRRARRAALRRTR